MVTTEQVEDGYQSIHVGNNGVSISVSGNWSTHPLLPPVSIGVFVDGGQLFARMTVAEAREVGCALLEMADGAEAYEAAP